MKSLKKIIILLVLLVAIFSFSKVENTEIQLKSHTEGLNIIDILSKQKYECRPSSEYLFYVESYLSNDRTPTIKAEIYMLNRKTNKSSLLADEKIKVSNNELNTHTSPEFLKNGDKIISNSDQDLYSFKELLEFETIYSSYVSSTNKLLNLNRSL
jgi:hypothetical protein